MNLQKYKKVKEIARFDLSENPNFLSVIDKNTELSNLTAQQIGGILNAMREVYLQGAKDFAEQNNMRDDRYYAYTGKRREYTIRVINKRNFNASKIAEDFRAHDFNVTEEAILHNFEAWKDDCKSGYRDEDNNYFLFTPCGCNDLFFSAMELTDAEWQKTYKA